MILGNNNKEVFFTLAKIVLFSMPFCPLSRKIAIALLEKKVPFQEIKENIWNPSSTLLDLNPMGEIPLLTDGNLVCGNHYVTCEYLEEVYTSGLMGQTPKEKARVRFWMDWFDRHFYQDVYLTLFYERVLKHHVEKKGPDTHILKIGRSQLRDAMNILEKQTEIYHYLDGKAFSWADITGLAHISCIDYIGDILWDFFPNTKEWYGKMKSRPSFRIFLDQTFHGFSPSPWYTSLDF